MSDNAVVLRDAFNLITGKQIGHGMSRIVYDCPLNPEWVVKVEDGAGCFQNVFEWQTWEKMKGTPLRGWFAPCLHISSCGSLLVMLRTTPPAPKNYLGRMPAFLCDFKRSNYGMIKGKLVCHDYGTNLLMEHGQTKRMRKAEWWDE